MTQKLSLLAVLVGACLALPASAQFAKPEDAIKYRQSALFVMAQHYGRIAAMASGKAPYDAAAASANADIVARMAALPWPAFADPETAKGQTRAKAEIWQEQAKFKEYQDKLIAETDKLVAVAKTNNLDQLKTQINATNNTCKTCHDAFRGK